MCEFKVLNEGRLVAKDIVYASILNGRLILKDALNSPTCAGNALIAEIDVSNETMKVKEDPLIGNMLQFLDSIASCERSAKYDRRLEAIWQEVKCRGDEMIRQLWGRYGRPG